uniref:CCHC-type domain-containing protein n=1 Tax=Dicentrarchus labrax TaxID=13489 RepID=A0A8C4GGX2_DICLA
KNKLSLSSGKSDCFALWIVPVYLLWILRPCLVNKLSNFANAGLSLCCSWVQSHAHYSTIWPKMDPAQIDDRISRMEDMLNQLIAASAAASAENRRGLAQVRDEMANIHTRTQALEQSPASLEAGSSSPASASAAAPPPVSAGVGAPLPSPREPNVGAPERYDGDPVTCNAFLCNCSIIFSLQPLTFSSEEARVAYTINHLTGRARLWGTAEWLRGTSICHSFQSFANELRRVFGTGSLGADAGRELLDLVQGSRSVTDFAIDFRTKAPMCDWNPAALRDVFMRGLAGYMKDELVAYELPSTLEGLIELATRLDLSLHSKSPVTPASSSLASTAPVSVEDPEPMQLGHTRLSLEERERRQRLNLCMYCGQPGHFVSRCPVKARAHQ